jgi:protein O-GlcNAc transferase
MAKKASKGGIASNRKDKLDNASIPPKVPSKSKKKSKPWSLTTSLPVIIIVGILAHFAYLILMGDSSSKTNDKPATKEENIMESQSPKTNDAVKDSFQNHELARVKLDEGMKFVRSNQLLKGLELIDQSIKASPSIPHGYNAKAGVLRILGRYHEALDVLKYADKVVTNKFGAEHPELYLIKQGLHFVYKDLGDSQQAAESIKMAIKLKPSADLYVSLAALDDVYSDVEKYEIYSKALELEPDHLTSFCLRYHVNALLGEWDKLEKEYKQVEGYMNEVLSLTKRTDKSCLQPYHISYLDFSAEMMRDTAIGFSLREAAASEGDVLPPILPNQVEPQFDLYGKRIRKLRIGYVSSDLQNHPVGRNVLGLFMAHNKEKYDIYCFSLKHSFDDPITTTIMSHVTYVNLSISPLSHKEIAQMIRDQYKIDVLVDLNGWTGGRRLQIFSANAAPVQVTHGLGFVGTTGLDAFQYFISDTVASPERFDEFYTEKVVRLPVAYLPASHKTVLITPAGAAFDPRTVDKMMIRKTNNLPVDDDIFVYCSFQSIHKISAEAFDTWMRILQSSQNSILWMTSIGQHIQEKILKRAESKHGISRDRFVFSGPQNAGDHMTRAQACDLHLDSWPYNAHSTAMDVIWAGVPILVYLPDYHDPEASSQVPKMCNRVSASLLHTLGMPQLIFPTLENFQDEAVRLSNDRQAYEALRNELLEKRLTSKLFDLIAYARHHEVAYSELFERFINGVKPQPLNIPLL